MATQDYYIILTFLGEAKVAEAIAEQSTISLTEMAVGDADYTPSKGQTSLVNEVWRDSLNSLSRDPENQNYVIAEAVIPPEDGGWEVREVGVFDGDGDLFAIGKYPVTYKPTLPEGSGKDLYIRFIMEISSEAEVTLLIDPAVVLATREYVDDSIASVQAELDALEADHEALETSHGALAAAFLAEHESDGEHKIDKLDAIRYGASSNGTDAYEIDLDPAPAAYYAGMRIYLGCDVFNVGACSVDVNQLGAVSIKKQDGTDPNTGDFRPGGIYPLMYDGTYFIIMFDPGTPVGETIEWRKDTAPNGYLEISGAIISMATYEILYTVLGNDYGLNSGTICTFTNATNTANATGHGLNDNDPIEFTNSGGALPTGLSADTTYYVINSTADTYQVSAAKGGSVVSFSDDGTGTNKFHNQFKLPDDRGRFKRGWDHGAGVDPDAASRTDRGDGTTGDNIGTKQADAYKNHAHNIRSDKDAGTNPSSDRVAGTSNNQSTTYSNTSTSGGNETRPVNINVMYCIKY